MQEFPNCAAEPPPDSVIVTATPLPAGAPAAVAPRNRISPVIVALVAALVLTVIVQIVASFGIAIVLGIQSGAAGEVFDSADFERFVTSPLGFIMLGLASQAAFLAVALVALRETRVAGRVQVGLARPKLSWWGYPSLALGSLLVAWLGALASTPVEERFGSTFDAAALRAQLDWTTGTLFVFFIGAVPGFVEEIFFRGYVQRRLLQRWPAWAAILVTSLAFAAMHMELAWMVFALPIGVWLGIVAWRSGSIWPAIVGHMTVNSVINLQSIAVDQGGVPDSWAAASLLLLLAASGFGFIVSIVVLLRLRPSIARPISLDVPPVAPENRAAHEMSWFDPGV